MPSRRTTFAIAAAWLLTTGFVAYRDLWPRLTATGPPDVVIDLADEAHQTVPIRWTIYRNGEKIGRIYTHIQHDDADDSFWFMSEYRQLDLAAVGVKASIPEMFTGVRVTRGGELREQFLNGKMQVYVFGVKFADVTADIRGHVVDGQLRATCDLDSNLGKYQQALDPVPATGGQPLNPLQPMSRLSNLHPGHSWYVEMSSPLDDAILASVRKLGLALQPSESSTLLAQVLPEPQVLVWQGQDVSCWVIEYRREEPLARTWVRIADGRVLQQEAFRGGERLAIERDPFAERAGAKP